MPRGPNIAEAREKFFPTPSDRAAPEPIPMSEAPQKPQDAPRAEGKRRSKRGKKKRILVSLDTDDMEFIERESIETGYAVAAIAAAHIKRDINRNKKI